MLQIVIVHEPSSVYVQEIRDIETNQVLSIFDKDTKTIDLSALQSHVKNQILVSHYDLIDNQLKLVDEREKTLTKTGVDENGFEYIQYC